jgi:hypothetical protein
MLLCFLVVLTLPQIIKLDLVCLLSKIGFIKKIKEISTARAKASIKEMNGR